MCNCLNELKANIARDLAIEHNVFDGVKVSWNDTVLFKKRNKQQRLRSKHHPTVSVTATFTRTQKNNGLAFKNSDVIVIPVKPIYCCQCGGKL